MTAIIKQWIREPWFINLLQIVGYALAILCGLLALLGGIPTIVTGQIGSVLSVLVGGILVAGGLIGSWSVITGLWWLERVALWIAGIGYTALLVPTLYYALGGRASTSTIWLIVALEFAAIIDCAKRYRRIDWAYLDPTK